MIQFGDTSAARHENLYRFQVDTYPQYDILRLYENKGRKDSKRKIKTIYDEKGFAWYANTETGEILRPKRANEIKRCVDVSVARTRKVMRELLMANDWQWFVTLTFNSTAQDRTDDKAVRLQWDKFRKDIRKRYPEMRYVAVMERHKDGCIHFHLVVGGISETELKLVFSGHYDKNGRKIYNCYAWKYGFSTVTEVESTEKVSGYILKYIGKSLGVSDEFKKRYWASKNCNRPKKRFVDILSDIPLKVFDFFDSLVDRTVTMSVQFWSKAKNYIAVKDIARDLRKTDFWFTKRVHKFECHYRYTVHGREYYYKLVKPKNAPVALF